MPTIPLISSARKTRNLSIMEADPAIMEAGKNARRPSNVGNGDEGNKPTSSSTKAIDFQHQKSNSSLLNKMKINRPLKMKGLKTKAFFRTDRPSLTSSASTKTSAGDVTKRDDDSVDSPSIPRRDIDSDADPARSKSDSSSTTLEDDEDDSGSSTPSSESSSFLRSWSAKTKALFSTTEHKGDAIVTVKKPRTNSASTSSFDAVSKLDSASSSSFMEVASNTSAGGETMNFDMSMSSNASEGGGESLNSEFGRVLQLDKRSGVGGAITGATAVADSCECVAESPRHATRAPNAIVAALNAPKPESTRGSQRHALATVGIDLTDDVFEESLDGETANGGGERPGTRPGDGTAGAASLGAAETLYAREIVAHFLKTQTEYQAMIPFPSSLGTLARGDTRAILISWIVQVHDYEGLENESLYLTVRITDTYCCIHNVVLAEIQLVGIAAIFIASKQEERFPPEGKDLVRYTNNAYTIDDLYKMEVEILNRLKFKVNVPICWTFAAYLLSLQRSRPREVDWMTHYLLELSLLSKPLIVVLPSLVASAAVYMARFLFLDDEAEDPWPTSMSVPATHNLAQLRSVVSELLAVLQATPNSKCNASFLKYSSESKFRGLSKMPILHNSYSLKRLAAASFGGGGLVVATNFGPPD